MEPRTRTNTIQSARFWRWCIDCQVPFILICSSLTKGLGLVVSGVPVCRVPLHQSNPPTPPYSLAVTSSTDLTRLHPKANFLATQVWPAARTAAHILERVVPLDDQIIVCEFGSGPGLPSITAAKSGAKKVITTDLDPFGLELVGAAAHEQGLTEVIETRTFNLVVDHRMIPEADLYVMSDVFESTAVAIGAARVAEQALKQGRRVWVFAQQDRAQREVFRQELIRRQCIVGDWKASLDWKPPDQGPPCGCNLWLCDVDETNVQYA